MTSATPVDIIECYLSHLDLCIASRDLKLGRVFDARLLKTSLTLHTLLSNRLVDLCVKCGSLSFSISSFKDFPHKNHQSWNTFLAAFLRNSKHLHFARQMFDEMLERNLVSYNTMISKLSHHVHHQAALKLFVELQREDLSMDKFTAVSIASPCAGMANLLSLRQLHYDIISNGLNLNCIMSSVLIDGYGKCGDANAARQVFDQMEMKDIVSWTSLARAYTNPNRLDDAYWVFIDAQSRKEVSWTPLISGLEQNRQKDAAVDLFG